jgi:ABC-type phosphate/phosphonate transport system substrate-binding protein
MNAPLIHRRIFRAVLLFVALVLLAQPAQAALVKIGVFSPEGFEAGMHRWQPTANYLSRQHSKWHFQVLPYQNLDELEQDALRGKFDFVLTQPASFVRLQQQAGLLRLLTRRQSNNDLTYTRSAVVIFTRADNQHLRQISDLGQSRLITTTQYDYSSWQLVQLELLRRQLDPDDLQYRATFAGDAPRVLAGVMGGEYPVGAMAARDFDRFLREGRITPEAVHILDARQSADFPFRYSGNLYPEWPLGALPDTPLQLREAVVMSLQSLPERHDALQAGEYAGWAQANNYHTVRPLLEKSLTRHVVERQLSVANLWLSQHRLSLLVSLVFTLTVWLLLRLFSSTRPVLSRR